MERKEVSRRAQMQSSETIFVVVIIIMIVILGLVFYSKAHEGSVKQDIREQRVLRMISLAHALSNWPELECSTLDARDFDCIDRMKLKVLSDFISESRSESGYAFNYYSDLLKRSSISVTEIYSYKDKESWVLYNNSIPGATRESVFIPVNVYDPSDQTFSFALLELAVYE
ncbi:hypothetical protein JW711_06285 [Candidatus Woesearchaeota archaeon]|nr:hypothetical protein [Candidatus Woesearchaeota archaeon]